MNAHHAAVHCRMANKKRGWGGGGGTQFVHGRSRMTIDPDIYAGTEHVGFSPTKGVYSVRARP